MVLDGTHIHDGGIGFRPLTGMVPRPMPIYSVPGSFRPLTGMVLLRACKTFVGTRFRPLTGMVPSPQRSAESVTSFRPLTGMVH